MLPSREIRCALGAICLWATQALILAKELPHLNIIIFLLLAFVFSGITLSIRIRSEIARFASLFGKKSSSRAWKKLTQIFAKPYVIAGIIGYFLYHFLFFHALDQGPVVAANLLNFLWPLFYVIMAEKQFPQEHKNGNEGFYVYSKILIGLLGCILLITRGGNIEIMRGNYLGPALGLLAALTWAAFTIVFKLQQRVTQEIQHQVWWACYPFGAALISLAVLLRFEDNAIIYDLKSWRNALIPALYFGVGPLGLAMIWYDKAVKHTQAQKLGRLTLLTPLLSTALLLSFSKSESMNGWSIVGGILVIVANMRLRANIDALIQYVKAPSIIKGTYDDFYNRAKGEFTEIYLNFRKIVTERVVCPITHSQWVQKNFYSMFNGFHRNSWDSSENKSIVFSVSISSTNLVVDSQNKKQSTLFPVLDSNLPQVHIKIANANDFDLARKGLRTLDKVRSTECDALLVDENTKLLGVQRSTIEALGLRKVRKHRVTTANGQGRIKLDFYGKARLTMLDQPCNDQTYTIDVIELTENTLPLLKDFPAECLSFTTGSNNHKSTRTNRNKKEL